MVDKIHEECRDTDVKKIDRWSLAAFGMPLEKLPLTGPKNIFNKLEPWQCDPKCLKSIANFSLGEKKRADSANVYRGGRRTQRTMPNEFNFQIERVKKKGVQKESEDVQVEKRKSAR